MSTPLDQLPDDNEFYDDNGFDDVYDNQETNYNYNPRVVSDNYTNNTFIAKVIFEKLKEPAVVSLITFILMSPNFVEFLFKLPFIERFSKYTTFSLAVLAGCIYFIIKNWVF